MFNKGQPETNKVLEDQCKPIFFKKLPSIYNEWNFIEYRIGHKKDSHG